MPRLIEDYPSSAQRLMIAAERLYGQHGLDGISLRQLAAEAGQGNNYAVQHHFGSKLGLIQAVSEMRLGPLEAERGLMLEAARHDGDSGVERMLGALLMPLVTVLSEADLEHYARFTLAVMRLDEHLHPFVKSADISPYSMEIHGRLAQGLAHLPHDVFRRRLSLACSLFLSAASQLGGPLKLSDAGYASRELYFKDVFSTSVAVLNAPFPPRTHPAIDMAPVGPRARPAR